MQHPKCPLCGGQDSVFRFSERDCRVLACQICDLFFIDPYPSKVDERHDQVSKCNGSTLDSVTPGKHCSGAAEYYRRYLPLIWHECSNAESILDVGCGTGNLLELMGKSSGLHRVGIELDMARAELAREVAGCEIYQMPVESFTYHTRFDVITMINVLSHILSFDDLFASIRSLLSDNGKLILKVGECTRDVEKRAIFDWGIPDHLHFLGMNTLQFISEKYGFEVLRNERRPFSYDLFSPGRWKAKGRSPARDAMKQIVRVIPFALPMLAGIYDIRYGRSVFSSFVVLTPLR